MLAKMLAKFLKPSLLSASITLGEAWPSGNL